MGFEKKDYKKCMFCGKILDSLLPFKCKRCGNYYCSKHRLPESHNCIVVSYSKKSVDIWKKEQKKFKKPEEDSFPKRFEIPSFSSKKPFYKHSNKFIRWFFWKNHPKSYLRKKPFLKNFGILLLISFLFWIVFLNINSVNSIILLFIKLGSLIEIILLLFFIFYFYKVLLNLRYGIRGATNGVRMILGISLAAIFILIIFNSHWIAQPLNDIDYDFLNPISTDSDQSASIRNPTYSQMEQFIIQDTTDSNPYVYYTYVCEDFARDTIENAKNLGIRGAMVYLNNPSGYAGHAIVAFQTTDRGLYFVEPQLDVIFSKGYMNEMIARRIYDIQTLYGGTYYGYTEYFNMPFSSYDIQYWNDNILKGTPGFELILVLCAIAVSVLLWKEKRNK